MTEAVQQPFFSLLMPAYNAQKTIAWALTSVRAQTFRDWEIIVVDDGSRDATSQIVERLAAEDSRIKLVRQANAGCGAARDSAAQHAQGKYFVRFDADDELKPIYLERMKEAIDSYPGYDIYCCNGTNRLPDGRLTPARAGKMYEATRTFTMEDLFDYIPIFTIALYSSEIYHKVGHINPRVYCEDVRFWFDCFLEGATCRYIPENLAFYTMSATQMTADYDKTSKSVMEIYGDVAQDQRATPEQRVAARAGIERVLNDRAIFARRQALISRVEGVVGVRAGRVVSSAVHQAGKLVRPLYARIIQKRREGGGQS